MAQNLTDGWEWAAPRETSAFTSKCDSRGPSGDPASVPLGDGTKARVGHGGTWDGEGAGCPQSPALMEGPGVKRGVQHGCGTRAPGHLAETLSPACQSLPLDPLPNPIALPVGEADI